MKNLLVVGGGEGMAFSFSGYSSVLAVKIDFRIAIVKIQKKYVDPAAVSIFPSHKFITGRICLGRRGTGLGTGFIV